MNHMYGQFYIMNRRFHLIETHLTRFISDLILAASQECLNAILDLPAALDHFILLERLSQSLKIIH